MMHEYPIMFDGIDADGNQLQLCSPSPLVKQLNSYLLPNSDVIDLGSHNGKNSYYLAEQGHNVVAVEENPEYINDGIKIIKGLGGLAVKHLFVESSIDDPQIYKQFDAVICTNVLQLVRKDLIPNALNTITKLTKPGGINLLRVYTGTHRDQFLKNDLNLFSPGEIFKIYQEKGWGFMDTKYCLRPMVYSHDGYVVSSSDTIFARKPLVVPTYEGRDIDYWRKINPSIANLIVEGIISD